MKLKNFLRKPIWLLGLVLIFSPITNYSQASRSSLSELLKEDANDRWMPFVNPLDMTPEQFFDTYRSELGLTQDDEMKMTKTRNSMKDGLVQETYQQYFKGKEVLGATMIAHIENNKLVLLHGDIGHNLSFDLNPSISLEEAMEITAKYYKEKGTVIFSHEKRKPGEPLILKPKEPNFPITILTNEKDVFSQNGLHATYQITLDVLETYESRILYIDIYTGQIIKDLSQEIHANCQTGTVHTVANGQQSFTTLQKWQLFFNFYRLDTDCNGYNIHTYWLDYSMVGDDIVVLREVDNPNNTWGSSSAPHEDASAHWATQKAWDFFDNTYDHRGPDGAGLQLDVHTRNQTGTSYNFINDRIAIGESTDRVLDMCGVGQVNIPINSWAALDVIAHEYTHAVILEGANLAGGGWNESGALHEGFADIFAAMLDRENGESFTEIVTLSHSVSVTPNPINTRSMQNPNGTGIHPGPSLTCFEPGTPDEFNEVGFWSFNGRPHTNSAPISHWFYLLATGATHQNGTTVTGIGYDDAALIAFETMMALPAAGDYADARAIAVNFAETEFGLCSPQHLGTIEAFNAIRVNPTVGLPNQNITGSITGSTYSLCYNVTETYTATLVPGATYNWLVGPGLQIISSSGNTCTVEKTNGSGSIILCNVSTPCDNTNFIRQINSTGVYFPQAPALVSTTYNICPGDYRQVNIMVPEPGMTYTWSMSPPNSGAIYPSGTTCIFSPYYNGTVTIYATPSNSCGTGIPGSAQFSVNSNFPGCQGPQGASAKKEFNNTFSLAPNPARDKVNITYTNASKVELVDIHGKTVLIEALNPKETQRKLSLPGLASGLYLVRLFDNQQALIGIEKLLVR